MSAERRRYRVTVSCALPPMEEGAKESKWQWEFDRFQGVCFIPLTVTLKNDRLSVTMEGESIGGLGRFWHTPPNPAGLVESLEMELGFLLRFGRREHRVFRGHSFPPLTKVTITELPPVAAPSDPQEQP